MKKVFSETGNLKIRFGKNNIEGIKNWAGLDYDIAMSVCEEVEDPVFDIAYEFPCEMVLA